MSEKPYVVDFVLGKLILLQNIPGKYSENEKYFAYPGGYGSTWDGEEDDYIEITKETPMYPTDQCCEVKFESDGYLYEIVEARQVDTGNPEELYGEWFENGV